MHTFERCRELKKLTIHGNIKLSDLDGWINPDTTNVFLDVPDDGTLYLPDTDKDVRDAILQKLKT
ncbi:hypothetical protein FACS1894218_6510 [Bacilli bacterium]|nr:hypothetical protein FACS1894218_6510 [Bacilli bacterium]